jgi:uncharacterized RDD family membrane protein YckC
MSDPYDPRRDVEPPRYASRPYISPFEQRPTRPDCAADVAGLWDVLSALVIDVALVVGAITLLAPKQDPALYALGWFVVRYLPLVIVGTNPGGLIAGIRVRGPNFGHANPLRILIRELLMPLGILVSFIGTEFHADEWTQESTPLVEGRMLNDQLAGTWTVEMRG